MQARSCQAGPRSTRRASALHSIPLLLQLGLLLLLPPHPFFPLSHSPAREPPPASGCRWGRPFMSRSRRVMLSPRGARRCAPPHPFPSDARAHSNSRRRRPALPGGGGSERAREGGGSFSPPPFLTLHSLGQSAPFPCMVSFGDRGGGEKGMRIICTR